MNSDIFQINKISRLQNDMLKWLDDDEEADIAIKIAALRSTAELMTCAVNQAAISASLAHLFQRK